MHKNAEKSNLLQKLQNEGLIERHKRRIHRAAAFMQALQ